jgi:hypothetical protein
MATMMVEVIRKIEELSASIGQGARINEPLATFQLNNKKITFSINSEHEIEVLLAQGNDLISIKRNDIEGIPAACFTDVHKMEAFLSQCYLKISEYSDHQGFKVTANLGLDGGGNIGTDIMLWPLTNDLKQKFVIPYRVIASEDAVIAHNIESKKTSRARALLAAVKAGERQDLRQEFDAIEVIFEAIKIWNNTGLIKLEPLTSTAQQVLDGSRDRWITFKTNNADGVCQAPCIGMCPSIGEHVVTCDIEGEFHSHPVQSILHEIGHVIGLRHEHARKDRAEYISTNFIEDQNCQSIGVYDFNSIMHYELGAYDGNRTKLDFSKKYSDLITRSFPAESGRLLQNLRENIGKTPAISEGDQEAVRALIERAKDARRLEEASRRLSRTSLGSSRNLVTETPNFSSSPALRFSSSAPSRSSVSDFSRDRPEKNNERNWPFY